jgi:hypothetical protein
MDVEPGLPETVYHRLECVVEGKTRHRSDVYVHSLLIAIALRTLHFTSRPRCRVGSIILNRVHASIEVPREGTQYFRRNCKSMQPGIRFTLRRRFLRYRRPLNRLQKRPRATICFNFYCDTGVRSGSFRISGKIFQRD